jgi:microcystin-dependent protein
MPWDQLCTPPALAGRTVSYRLRFDGNDAFLQALRGFLEPPCNEAAWTEECESGDVSAIITSQAWTAGWRTIEKDMAQIGTIFPTAAAAIPDYALACDGSIYNRVDYPELYSVLDSAFIIDADSFHVPDLQGRVPIGAGSGGGLSSYAIGDTGGEESHTLVSGEMPSHVHTEITASPSVGAAITGVPVPSAIPGVGFTGSAGGDGAHENRQPYLALAWYIVYA